MEKINVQNWMEGYIKAWNSNDPEDIGRLFTPNARYYTAPFREPWQGRDGIISGWLERRDEPGEFEFRYQVQTVSGNTAYVRGWTKYHQPPREYSNLWVVKLNERGECEQFTEWWMKNK